MDYEAPDSITERWPYSQEGCIRDWVDWTCCQRTTMAPCKWLLTALVLFVELALTLDFLGSGKNRLRTHSTQLETPASKHHDPLGHMVVSR